MLDKLRKRQVPTHIAKMTEIPIRQELIKPAIRKIGNNKSLGPDGLSADEFYHKHNYLKT